MKSKRLKKLIQKPLRFHHQDILMSFHEQHECEQSLCLLVFVSPSYQQPMNVSKHCRKPRLQVTKTALYTDNGPVFAEMHVLHSIADSLCDRSFDVAIVLDLTLTFQSMLNQIGVQQKNNDSFYCFSNHRLMLRSILNDNTTYQSYYRVVAKVDPRWLKGLLIQSRSQQRTKMQLNVLLSLDHLVLKFKTLHLKCFKSRTHTRILSVTFRSNLNITFSNG